MLVGFLLLLLCDVQCLCCPAVWLCSSQQGLRSSFSRARSMCCFVFVVQSKRVRRDYSYYMSPGVGLSRGDGWAKLLRTIEKATLDVLMHRVVFGYNIWCWEYGANCQPYARFMDKYVWYSGLKNVLMRWLFEWATAQLIRNLTQIRRTDIAYNGVHSN